jgi:hypothetical protein
MGMSNIKLTPNSCNDIKKMPPATNRDLARRTTFVKRGAKTTIRVTELISPREIITITKAEGRRI